MSTREPGKIVAIIPARGGSKGIPKKNIIPLQGKPLIAYTIDQAQATKHIDKVVVSTDDQEISAISSAYGAEVIHRPANLSGDMATSESALVHALKILKENKYNPEIVVFLQCTSPLRRNNDIEHAIQLLIDNNYDSVFSVTENYPFIWLKKNKHVVPLNRQYHMKRPMRQHRIPEYIENGSIYVFKTSTFLKTKNRTCGRKGIYIMPREYSFEIDSDFDLWLCEQILKRKTL
jgi:CMP-N,N'-diacetyllegionaminic acid synthase